MKSTVAPLEGNKVRLTVEVDEAEFDKDIDAAFRKIAREVRLPGFRPGKAPRRVLEARIGVAPAREQALRDGIPVYLARAVREHEVDIIAQPEVDITTGTEDGPVAFDATIEVRPKVSVPGYGGLRVEVPSIEIDPADIDGPIDAERRRHGSLVDVDRPAARGDQVTVDLAATRDGEPVPGLTTEDWLYEIGRGWVADTFDDELVGATVGDELAFTATPSGTEEPADFVVAVTKVQELALPELTDEWVAENVGEYETVAAWRQAVAGRLEAIRIGQVRQAFVERTTQALADLVDEEPPEALVTNDLQARAQGFVEQLQRQGIPFENYLAITGQTPEQITEGLKEASVRAVKADLGLRAVAEAEGLVIDDDDLEAEYARIAVQVNMKASQVRKEYEKQDAVANLRSEMRNRKALDWLLHRVEIVDPDGKMVDRSLLLPGTGDGDTAVPSTDQTSTEASEA
jgi:trigger factor